MTDRPIIFSAPMVRALLDGRKTQTRRLAKSPMAKCQPGDRLYVREAWGEVGWREVFSGHRTVRIEYRAGKLTATPAYPGQHHDDWPVSVTEPFVKPEKWRPSIHMPRAASRLTLAVTEVRRQRLQDIGDDWRAEGVQEITCDGGIYYDHGTGPHRAEVDGVPCHPFKTLWESLHGGKPGEAWADNPEIVALTFTVHHCNIDTLS